MLNDMNKWIKTTTDVGIALLGLAIIVQILFGGSVPFFSGNVIFGTTIITGLHGF